MELTCSCILPEVKQLLEDEESQVRTAGLVALVDIIPHLDAGTYVCKEDGYRYTYSGLMIPSPD